jgi:hypothetical protein
MRKLKSVLFLTVVALGLISFTSCSVAPTRMIWRPWTRVISLNNALSAGSSISVTVTGKTNPLIGDESLYQSQIKSEFEDLIKRRGFIVSDKGRDYSISVQYETVRRDLTRSELNISQRNYSIYATKTAAGTTSKNLGAAVASAIVLAGSSSQSVVNQIQRTEIVYTNVISLECKNVANDLVWKGESTWDSEDLDSREGVAYALRLLVADLPKRGDVVEVPMVINGRGQDFLRLNAGYRSYSSPALPYKVMFLDPANNTLSYNFANGSEPAYAGFIDLVKYAESALPDANMSWKDPINRNLWKTVTLGGMYKIGDATEAVPLMIRLKGLANGKGYLVSKAWIASAEEFNIYQSSLLSWQARLAEFFNVLD